MARSLDPDSMETVPVKTKTGDITTIIVKKRQGKSNNVTGNGANNNVTTNYVLISKSEEFSVNGTENTTTESMARDKIINNQSVNFTAQNVTASQNRTDRSDHSPRVPEPVYVSSSMIYVKNEQNAGKKSRSLVKLDYDGIPIVTGVRVPDDETDKQIWRNARVINGVLVPYDKSDKEALNKQKPARKPTTPRPTVVQTTDGWMKIGSIIKKPSKLNPVPSESKEDTWTSDPRWDVYKKPASARPVSPTEPQMLQTIDMGDEPEKSRPFSEYSQYPLGLWVSQENSADPEHKYVTDRILEYIKNINKEEMKRLSVQKFTARDARMLPTTHEQPAIQSRILHVPGSSVFPNSAMYSPSTQPPSRVSFEEGVRTPVLQYAHPEYGVQSAKAEPTPIDVMESKKDQLFFAEDIHSDRGPFAFEPATPSDATKTITDKRSHAPTDLYQRPKKTLAYFYPEKQVYLPNKYYGKYPAMKNDYKVSDYPTIYYEDLDGRPFWLRIGDSLKEQVQSGIDKVTDLTRPVVEPLVEATQKISQNLGLSSGNRDLSTIREKLGTVSTSSLILPAIGIVAGGAALGLGAVAVGRYLNYDVVKMRNGKSIEFENNLEVAADPTVAANLENMWAEDNSRSPSIEAPISKDSDSATSRKRRSTNFLESDKYLENILQSLDAPSEQQMSADNYPSSMWSDTPCSKKIFCEAMLTQPEDAASLMDKKIYTFLSLIHPDIAATVAPHLEDVMRSVKTKNCSKYVCPSWRPSKQKQFSNGT